MSHAGTIKRRAVNSQVANKLENVVEEGVPYDEPIKKCKVGNVANKKKTRRKGKRQKTKAIV